MNQILSNFALPIVLIGLAVAGFSAFLMFARNYRKCPPNKVLVVYGRKKKDGKGYRLIIGGSAFVLPLFEQFQYLDLETFPVSAEVTKTPNVNGVPVNVQAIANIKISSDPAKLAAAVERVLGKSIDQIQKMLKDTLDGLLRQIIGTLTVEEMVTDREKLNQGVLMNAMVEMNKLGFELDNFVINKLWDDEGYIDAMGAKRTAEVKRDATIAQAEADRESMVRSSEARQIGETAKLAADERVAQANRDLDLKKASFMKETATAQAEANMAEELKKAEIDKDLRQRKVAALEAETKAKITLAEQEAQRVEKELVYTKIRPAEAEAKAASIKAEGDSKAATITAEGNANAAVKQAQATTAQAEATKTKLTLEGEGQAAADAEKQRRMGLADAEVAKARLLADAEGNKARLLADAEGRKANLLAEAEGIAKRGEAEGSAIQAKLVAEAIGLEKKNLALATMSDGTRFIITLEMLPSIIERLGDAGQKVVGSAFEQVGAGLSRVDSINIVDLGNGGGNGDGNSPIARFALSTPEVIFGTLAKAKALGLDFGAILEKLGMPKGALDGLLNSMKQAVVATDDTSKS